MQQKIERVRKANAISLPNLQSLAQIETDHPLIKLPHRCDRFLLIDTGADDPERIIAFTTDENLRLMYISET